MKVFLSEKEVNYGCPDKYAFLNWRFDDGYGSNGKNRSVQAVFDNFEMGKAYMSNSTLGLYSILYYNNGGSIADSLIFPILFNIWHGIELWLKSGIGALRVLNNNSQALKFTHHKISELRDEFQQGLENINMSKTNQVALVEVNNLIDEFNKVNANFDFARYSFASQGDFQFYNAPIDNEKQWQKDDMDISLNKNTVPNTCVDIRALFEILIGIIVHFKELLYYLTICIETGEGVTEEGFERFRKADDHLKNDKVDDDLDPIEKIMSIIFSEIIN